MKREIRPAFGKILAMAVAAAVFAASADTLTWTGGGGNALWSNAGNWLSAATGTQAVPQNGDSVAIDIGTTAVTMNNDIENLTLAKFSAVGQNDVVLTLDGNPIGIAGIAESATLTGKQKAKVVVWTNSCSLVLNADISLSGGNGTFYFGGYSTVTYGDIGVASGCALKIRGRPNSASKGPENGRSDLVNNNPIVNFYGDIGGDGADLFLDLPLYFGLLGTVASFIVMSFNPNISRLIAYPSTLVGIIFSVILRLTLQYPLKQTLICASAELNGKDSKQ